MHADQDPALLYHEKQVSLLGLRALRCEAVCWFFPIQQSSPLQVASLCGVHCLNTLLQGPTFSGMDLGQVRTTTISMSSLSSKGSRLVLTGLTLDLLQIAQDLDRQERAFMAEGGMESEDYLKYMAEDSGNVAADGNFSVMADGLLL